MEQIERFRSRLEDTVFAPLVRTGDWYWRLVALLCLIIAWGIYAYVTQFREGLIETGMRDRISWGLYIAVFVFVIGISHAGTLISAILRVTKAGWRTPITRMAEFITVAALLTGVLFIIVDLGRPDRMHHLMLFPRWQSPITWDFMAVATYLVGSVTYLYLFLIPDLARVRDRLGYQAMEWKRRFFSLTSLGWKGLPEQKRYLGMTMTTMMIIIIPIAVSVHTVISWIFSMTLREPWDSPMFGIYFVMGAIFSGIATCILIMAILRRVYHLEEYITQKQFLYLGYMLAALAVVMTYLNGSEYITAGYKVTGEVGFHLRQTFTGAMAPFYWVYVAAGMVAPILIILIPWTRTLTGVIVASALVNVGMWLERYMIVVGGLRVPLMPYEASSYAPTWVEFSIMAGLFAWFALLLTIFTKLFPIIAIWEVEEQHEKEVMRS
jgi:molybdopterin-containing oxidoreductase family membrane subunit